jgi:hypothetical protein
MLRKDCKSLGSGVVGISHAESKLIKELNELWWILLSHIHFSLRNSKKEEEMENKTLQELKTFKILILRILEKK